MSIRRAGRREATQQPLVATAAETVPGRPDGPAGRSLPAGLAGLARRLPRSLVPRSYTSMVAVDIVSFGAPYRDEEIQMLLRQLMYGHLEEAFEMSHVPWHHCYHEDRGDGALVVLPPDVPAYLLADVLPYHLHSALRRVNRFLDSCARMRLRMAAHVGNVYQDPYGVSGHAVNHLFRLLDADALKGAVRTSRAPLGVILSDRLREDLAAYGGPLDVLGYRAVDVVCKETEARAWVRVLMEERGRM